MARSSIKVHAINSQISACLFPPLIEIFISELLTGFEGSDTGSTGNIYEDILNITAVHPLREDTLRKLLEKDNADFQVVESLLKQKLIRSTIYKGKRYYLREYHINRS